MKRGRKGALIGYLYILPAMAILGVFILFPILWSFGLSVTDYSLIKSTSFVGWDNYTNAFQDPLLVKSFLNTFIYTASIVGTTVGIGLILALLLRTKTKGISVYKAVYFIPVMISWVATSLVWRWLYHPTYSVINYYLSSAGIPSIQWITSPKYSLFAIIVMSTWKELGYNMVLFLAGLGAIPTQLYEAGAIDGANRWQQFWHITMPSLRPIVLFIIVVTAIYGFRMFTQSYVLTGGGPSYSSISAVQYIYMAGFKFLKMGYASTISVILFLVVLAFTLIQLKIIGGRNSRSQ